MTLEERNNAIKVLKNFDLNNSKVNSLLFSAEEITSAFDTAVKALEQEPILDKIRTELIQSIQNGIIKIESGNEELFRILDKYKAESEKINCKTTKCENCVNHNYCDFESQESEDKK